MGDSMRDFIRFFQIHTGTSRIAFSFFFFIATCIILIVTRIFKIVYEATSESASATPSELAANYLRCIDPGVYIPLLETPQEAFEYVSTIITEIPTGAVTHSGSGLTYGKSFTAKNQAPVDFTASLLIGRGSWSKATIEASGANITDVGCGLGLSAVSFMSKVITTYRSEGWHLDHPIQFDLCDINPAHQTALQALAALVNAAYPEYFHVTATCSA